MHLWAFDVGSGKFGWAAGKPGAVPTSGVWRLKAHDQHPSVAGSNLLHTLNEHWTEQKPAMVVKEAPLALEAFAKLGNAAHTVAVTFGLHAIVEAMCVRHGIPFHNVHVATIRKHFCGRARYPSRAEAKRAVVQRCHLLEYMPLECTDDNRADALAAWDYASQTWGKKRPGAIHLFGETAA